jgi:hypothetical protein
VGIPVGLFNGGGITGLSVAPQEVKVSARIERINAERFILPSIGSQREVTDYSRLIIIIRLFDTQL